MKPTLFALTALGALAAASPAVAQTYNGYGYNGSQYRNGQYQNGQYQNGQYQNGQYQNGYYNQGYDSRYSANGYSNGWESQLTSATAIDTRIARLDARLQAGVRSGTIDRYEADRLRAEIRDLRSMSRRYSYNGLDASERADLAARLRSVREDIRSADNGSWDRYDNSYWGGATSYGSNGYGNNGYGSTYTNGYGSNGYGTSYSNNGYSGQGGPYEEVETCQSRGGLIGGLIDSVAGRNCTTTLRVGERVSTSLYGVPYELRGTYRDGYGYYYRSDGNAIYQIDSRSNTVLRVYPMNR